MFSMPFSRAASPQSHRTPMRAARPPFPLHCTLLEPRVLLDAAALQTAQAALAAHDAAPPETPHPPSDNTGLMEALAAVHQDAPAAPHGLGRTEIFFIDASVADAAHLAHDLPAGSEVHVIDPEADGVAVIAQTLQGRSDVDAIHILGHGQAGALQLGTAALTAQTMGDTYRGELGAIGQSLAPGGDLLVYGCDFGRGEVGGQAVRMLAELTGADVAASIDDTGAASLGGDWDLERRSGTVETAAVAAPDWGHLMTAPVLSTAPVLTYTAVEDAAPPVGAVGVLVSDYTVGMTDADPDALRGIAITRNVATNGAWWYTTDGGATWAAVGAVATNNVLLLADDPATRLYFQADPDFTGSAGTALTLLGWDRSAGTAGTRANPNTLAGSLSSASDTVAVTVSAVNDAPVLTTTTFNLTTTAPRENYGVSEPAPDPTTPPGARAGYALSFPLTGSDIDTGARTPPGIAIVGADNSNGQWWYSTDSGATWTLVGNASDADAVLLDRANSSRLFFAPYGDWNGTTTFTVRSWDMSQGTSGQRIAITETGGTSAFSTTTAVGSLTMTPFADITADTLSGANSAVEEVPKVFNPIAGTGGARVDAFEGPNPQITAIAGQAIAPGGSVTLPEGTVSLAADGQTLTFVGAAGFSGQAVFSYTVLSGASETANITLTVNQRQEAPVTAGGVTETATVAVDVLAPNTPPVPENPEVPGQDFDPGTNTYTAATPEDAPFSGQVRAGDPDGDVPSYTLGTPPAHGTVTLDAVTGAYVYTPTADFNGPDSFVVTVTDGRGAIVPMTVNMGVTPVVDIADDQAGTRVNTPVAIDFNANDSFESADHVLTAINGVPIAVGAPLNVANGTVTRNADGTLTFAPALDFSGSTSFDYTVTAGGVTETAMVTVVVAANRPPVPGDSDVPGQDFDPNTGAYTATTVEDMAFAGRLAASDADGDPLTYTLTTPPANGTVTVDPATGAYTYVPRADFNGVDTFIVTVSDGMGGVVALPVNMLVTPVADAIDDSAATRANTPVVIAIGANDSFENPDHVLTAIDGAAVVAGTPVAVPNGTAVLGADGTLTFTPAPGFVGRTSFTYTVTSGGVTETATVTVDANANRPPVPSDPGNVPGQGFDPDSGDYFITTPQDTPYGGRLASADADGDTLAYTTETPPRNGTVVVNPDGSYAYVPNPGYVGEDSFVVRVDDGQGGEVTSTVYVNVTPVAQVQEVPPRQDFPFVARPPVPDDVGPPQPDIIRAPQPERNLDPDARPFADAQSLFAEPAVVIGVNGQGWLGGTPALASVGGAVLQATDGIASLGGLNTATGRGIVVSAVDDLSPLGSIDSRDAGRRGAWLRDGAGDPLAAEPGRIASLDLGSGVRLAMMQEGERVWLDVQGPVREVRASLANGGALPPWVHVDRRGFVAIDRPSNVDSLRLRLTVVPERGPARSQVIEIDFNSGEMREVGSRGASSRGGAGRVSQGQAPADVPDFGTQLARAASRAAADDAALLEALALV